MRGVTNDENTDTGVYVISTHTPHARRDLVILKLTSVVTDFYSHASCEA